MMILYEEGALTTKNLIMKILAFTPTLKVVLSEIYPFTITCSPENPTRPLKRKQHG